MTSVQPIEIKIFGDNINRLQAYSRQVADIVQGVTGAADVFDGIVIAGPSVSIIPDNSKLAQYGLTPAAFQTQLQLALEGVAAGTVLEKEQLSTIRLVYANSRTQSVQSLKNLQLFLPSGGLKPISQLATIVVKPGEAEIERENLQSMGVVTARLENRDLGSTVAEIQKKIASQVSFPQGYHVVFGGEYAEQQQSFHELLLILITSCLLVFGVILIFIQRRKGGDHYHFFSCFRHFG